MPIIYCLGHWRHYTQHKDSQHNYIQLTINEMHWHFIAHTECYKLNVFYSKCHKLDVTNKSSLLSVIMLNVVMLSVVVLDYFVKYSGRACVFLASSVKAGNFGQ